jgi:hypothetical protein
MTLEQIVQQLGIPFFFGLIGSWIILSAKEGDDWEPPFLSQLLPRLFLGALIAGAGLIVADLYRRGLLMKPKDWMSWSAKSNWEWMVPGVTVAALALAILRSLIPAPSKYAKVIGPASICLGIGLLYWSLSDQAINDQWTHKVLFPWLAVTITATVVNTWCIDNMMTSGASRWAILILAGQMGCVALLAFQSYASLGLWMLSAFGLALGAFVASSTKPTRLESLGGWQLSAIIFPLIPATIATFFLAHRFGTDRLPNWLNGCILFLPFLTWAFDAIYTRTCWNWFRILWAFIVCAAVVGAIVWYTNPFEAAAW